MEKFNGVEVTGEDIEQIFDDLKIRYGDNEIDNMTFGEAIAEAKDIRKKLSVLEDYFGGSFDVRPYMKKKIKEALQDSGPYIPKEDQNRHEKWLSKPIRESESVIPGIDERT